jgi:hypothetical protein
VAEKHVHEGGSVMQKFKFIVTGLTVLAVLVPLWVTRGAAQNEKLIGTWNVTLEANSEFGSEARRGNSDTETLTISQKGGKYTVEHKSLRGDQTYDAKVDGNSIFWTEDRKTDKGESVKVNYSATLHGKRLDGSYEGGPYDRGFTAKRAGK